ncbi:hypothetical protein BU26DRAFT_533225 [Trematosphaeria pertusa]|uniref:DUF7924 domain-containing protein n=1 Tax=Trematosphaeria pertusa TaxID=390896 RepID=A0A6A6I3P8_9PLEO|nr:uncharacterized protein BU26DRAFT_533225 [Trematosphaeria pertusa]KAF2245124.1 hypothetical protein BU26DRAFT_533225 [Trematosphaeria pertusa]
MKRQLDTTTESDPLPAKRARLTRTGNRQPSVKEGKAEQADKRTLQQPKPNPPKHSYASFLEDFVDPVHVNTRPTSVHAFVSEWLESVGSDREKRCRSDTYLHRSDNPISRNLTRSAPDMSSTRDIDGFAVPPTPLSTGSRPRQPKADSRSSVAGVSDTPSPSGVRHRMYRQNNLEFNHIFIRRPDAPLPTAISGYINDTLRAERDSPELSAEEMKGAMSRLSTLAEGCDEDDVAAFLNGTIFPDSKTDPVYGPAVGLMSSSSALMSQHLIPVNPASPYKVTQPKPDKLYGYSGNTDRAFTQPQLLAQTTLHPQIPLYPAATSQGLRFPFFAIEFKAAGGTRGDLWVATNQCAGASSACLNAMDQLNVSLREYQGTQRVDNLCCCIAVDNNTAQLYISWREDDLNYYLQQAEAFLLWSPEHFRNFRKQVRNILDWGKDARLQQIRDALDIILTENRKKASEASKSRPPPSDGSSSNNHKRRQSSSRGNRSRSDSAQGQSSGAKEPHWEWDSTIGRYFHRNADGTLTWAEAEG